VTFLEINYLRNKQSNQINGEDQMMEWYKEDFDGYWDHENNDDSYHYDNSNDGDDFNILVSYFVPRECSLRLLNQFLPDNLNNPKNTDHIVASTKDVEIYAKFINTIKNLPKSLERNLVLSNYQKIVDKYANLMEKIIESWDKSEYSNESLDHNVHIRNFKNDNKVTYKFWSIFKIETDKVVELLLHLSENFEFCGASFDELPIIFSISSFAFEMHTIWFDHALWSKLNLQIKIFKEMSNSDKERYSLNCLPLSVLSHRLFKQARNLFFEKFVFDVETMKIEIKETMRNTENLIDLCWELNKVLERKFHLKWIKKDFSYECWKEDYHIKLIMLACPPEVNAFLIKTPLSARNHSNKVDDFSIFLDSSRINKYVVYNMKIEMKYSNIIKIIGRLICRILVTKKKLFFNNTFEIRNFIARMQPNRAIEIIQMQNKFTSLLVANISELFESEENESSQIANTHSSPLKHFHSKLNHLILKNLNDLQLFQILTENTFTSNNSE
jgi:hypothetical protein